MNAVIRKIRKEDNAAIAALIREVLTDHNVPKTGTAYADASLDCMFETYQDANAVYFVIEEGGKILGGAGVAPLQEGPADTCELQKMYFLPVARGRGLGSKMMEKCLDSARGFGFKQCYLETMPYMKAAQKLYSRYGFEYLQGPLGNTGHSSCPVWMTKQLV